jgi:AcrR family transcriptional regulator
VSSHRRYKLKARADRQRETRERIVAATEALHREVGPARTTIADIARLAGVQRLTVYNHFPQLKQLLGACQAHFLTAHPPPDIAPGQIARKHALERLEAALTDLYGWFRTNRAMEKNVNRDRHLMPELDELLSESADRVFDGAAAAYASKIASGRKARITVQPLVRMALDFNTWQLVTSGGLNDRQAARMLAHAIACVA